MVGDNLRSLLNRDSTLDLSAPEYSESANSEYEAYANGRVGVRPQISVTFEKMDGKSLTLSYAHLYSLSTDCPNEGFVAEFSDHNIVIAGRNLERLHQYLGDHRVRHILQTSASQSMQLAEDQPVVEKLQFISNKPQPLKP